MTPEIIIVSFIISIVASVVSTLLLLKFNTLLQNYIVDHSEGLHDRIVKELHAHSNESVLMFYLGRIWFKVTIAYFVAIIALFVAALAYSTTYTRPEYSTFAVPFAAIFTVLFGYKITQVAKLYNAERVAKHILKTQKGLVVFETNVFWRAPRV